MWISTLKITYWTYILLWSDSWRKMCARWNNINPNYNQQDATFLKFIYLYRRSTCFRRFLRPSSGAHNCTYSFRYCQPLLLLAATVDEMELSLLHFSWIYFYRRSTYFSQFPRPSSGAHNRTYSFRYCQPLLLLAATVDEMEHLLYGSAWQQYWLTIHEAVCKVMCSWWWAEKPPETCRASVKINKFKKRCILLVVICIYITMHGYMNIIKKNIYKYRTWNNILAVLRLRTSYVWAQWEVSYRVVHIVCNREIIQQTAP
jgi:hypothetical protein